MRMHCMVGQMAGYIHEIETRGDRADCGWNLGCGLHVGRKCRLERVEGAEVLIWEGGVLCGYWGRLGLGTGARLKCKCESSPQV